MPEINHSCRSINTLVFSYHISILICTIKPALRRVFFARYITIQRQIKTNKMQTITINKNSYQVGFSFRAIKYFEDLTKKSVSECTTTWDNLVFFYSTIKALNPEFTETLDEFTQIMDQHPDLLIQFQTLESDFTPEPPATNAIKKKWPTKSIFVLWTLLPFVLVSPVLIPVISMIAWIGASLWLLARLIAKIGKKPA